MTVEQVVVKNKKNKSKKGGVSNNSNNTKEFESLDALMQKIDAMESEEQVPELFEEEQADLLTSSFKSLLSLMNIPKEASDDDDDFDTETLDESVMEIMSQFLDEGLIDEEEFEDFFTDELNEENEDGEEESDFEEEDEVSEVESVDMKTISSTKQEKKSKHMKELEMLMEKVDDESDLDDDEYESEEDDNEEDDQDDYEEEEEYSDSENSGKKDIFAEDITAKDGGRMSSFEKAQAALKNEISALEAENLNSERPWALRGEINARQRPSDSLLEEAVDFDNLSRPTPQITEERSEEIEDIIKRRIAEAAWDDVERKDGRDLTLLNGMPANGGQKPARALLEDVATAGPQRSLTQVYEDEAATKLSGTSAADEETLEKQKELTALFAKICRHVDGLSGNRFAPKIYVQSDFQIKTLGKK